jgi:hypothetical protein
VVDGPAGVDDGEALGLGELGRSEDGAQRGVLARQAVIRREHAVQRPQRMRRLDAIGLGERRAANQVWRAVRRTAVGVDHHCPQPGEVAGE